MKSPNDIRQRLIRQWHQPSIRTQRLLSAEAWPLQIDIGKPSAQMVAAQVNAVQEHVKFWRAVTVGEVEWQWLNYRASAEPVCMPKCWRLRNPSEWVAAGGDTAIQQEYRFLEAVVSQVPEIFHASLVSQRNLWQTKSAAEVVAAANLAIRLSPGCAGGKPLRLLSEYGVDTKFFERHSQLLTRLLDERFDGAVAEQGLTTFLDALEESDHWLLVAPLAEDILPFKRQRVSVTELEQTGLPCSRILVVENEKCLHLLPYMSDTVAILGAGLNLQWLQSPRFAGKKIGYWGDLDTWGLLMLARARQYHADIVPLLMNQEIFLEHSAGKAVVEPVQASPSNLDSLTERELGLFHYLMQQDRGRLEQEYLPQSVVEQALLQWGIDFNY
jgi:hypothetical protein